MSATNRNRKRAKKTGAISMIPPKESDMAPVLTFTDVRQCRRTNHPPLLIIRQRLPVRFGLFTNHAFKNTVKFYPAFCFRAGHMRVNNPAP